jgi:succinate dehydrogenase / fumarate reductase flavoprotein subunit
VLIIGAGGAGLRVAVEIGENRPHTKVLALTKLLSPQKSHTSTAQGGAAAVDPNDPTDKIIYHMFDTWKGSDCSGDQSVIQKVCESAWDQIVWFERHGMHFSRTEEGRIPKRVYGGHTLNFGKGGKAARTCYEADRTGKGIMDTVWGEALKHDVRFMNMGLATELLFDNGRCVGALVFLEREGKFVGILAKATVITTGGKLQMYLMNTNCRQNTGDGLALVLEAGLPVMDLEAVQFHPTGLVGLGFLAAEAIRGYGGILRNKDGEAFMAHYAPVAKDLAPRDFVSRCIMEEIRKGRGLVHPDYKLPFVWLDLRHLPEYIHTQKLPEVESLMRKFLHVEPRTDLCPVAPVAHYQMGGIPTDDFGRVQDRQLAPVAGLFACGEVAAASLHGFNRLGTNSLIELITMGQIVGQNVSEYLKDTQDVSQMPKDAGKIIFSQFSRHLNEKGNGNYSTIRNKLRSVMMENVGIFRTQNTLRQALETLGELKEETGKISAPSTSLAMNQRLVEIWELNHLIDISAIIAQGALHREESRGAHFREDYPERRDEFNYHTLATMPEFDKISIGKRPIDMSIFEDRAEYYEYFDFIERKY